jgi:hypothetical protein
MFMSVLAMLKNVPEDFNATHLRWWVVIAACAKPEFFAVSNFEKSLHHFI